MSVLKDLGHQNPQPLHYGRGFLLDLELITNHTQTPVFAERSLLGREEQSKWLLSDSGRKTAAKNLANVIVKTREKREVCVRRG